MPSGWRSGRFDEFITLQRGFDLPVQFRSDGDFPIVASNGIIGTHAEMKVKGPGVITGRSGTIGKVIYENRNFWPLNTTLYVKDFHNNNVLFSFYFLQHFKLERFSNGTGVPTLNRNDVHLVEVIFPPKAEQEMIAKILSTWDEAIAAVSAEILKQKFLFEGLIISLYSGRRRFCEKRSKFRTVPGIGSIPEDWKLLPMSEFARPVVRAVKKPDGRYTGLGIRSHGRGTFRKPDSESEKIALEELFEVKANDLLVSITFAWEGAIAIANKEDDGALTSHRFPAFEIDTSKINLNYLRYYIRKKSFIGQLGLISPGGAGRNRVLKKSDFLNLEISVPNIEEQTKIGNALFASEKLISLLSVKRDLLRIQKQGLMQQLLTGKKRVKV